MHLITRKFLFQALLIVACCFWKTARADTFEECNADNSQQFIASNKSCAHFILCNGEDSHEGECPEGDKFVAELQMCEIMDDIDCRTGQIIQTEELPASELPVNGNVTVTIVENNANATTQVTPASNSTSVTNQVLAIDTTSPASWTNEVVTIVANSCPRTDNPSQIVLLAHDKSCTDYYICYHGNPLPMNCAAMLHFNAKTGKCDKAEIVKCLTSAISVREQCKLHTVDIYPHPDNCNYFYYCRNGYLMLQQCPFFYGWDYEKRSCVAISQAKCFGRTRL